MAKDGMGDDPDMGQVGEIMRWRWTTNAEGKRVPESNVRMVEWSDGSRTLMVGEEAFAVREAANAAHTELWVRHDRGASDILECQGFLQKKITLRPQSLKSKAHARLAVAANLHEWKNRDETRVKMFNEKAFENHEKTHEKREKARDEELRSREKYSDPLGGGAGRSYDHYSGADDGMTGNLGRLRDEFKKGRRGRNVDESRLMRAKGGFDKEEDFSPSEASDDDDGDEPTAEDNAFLDDDDDDEIPAARAAKRARTAMDDDDDD